MDMPDLLAQIQAKAVGPAPAGPTALPHASLQAAVQAELQNQLRVAQAEFEAKIQEAMEAAQEIQHSDLVSVRLSIGDEATFRRTAEGSVEALIAWMISNGWAPVGVPGT